MNPSALQRLNRLAASLGIGFVMLVVGWWCLTIEPVMHGRAAEASPSAQVDTCVQAEDPVYDPTFDSASGFGRAEDPARSVAVGDLDLDGDLDLVMGASSEAAIYLNDGQGGFQSTPDQILLKNSQANLVAVAVADMSGDGALDIIVASHGQADQVFFNKKDDNDRFGIFEETVVVGPQTSNTTALAVGDLNGDAGFDVVAGYTNGQGVVYRHITPTESIITPSFEITRPFGPVTASITSLAVGDLSGDGQPDIVAAYAGGTMIVYWNDGLDDFPSRLTLTTTLSGPQGNATSLALVDIDGKNGLDVVAAHPRVPIDGSLRIRISIFLNNGQDSKAFTSHPPICRAGSDTPVHLAAGDVDNDGRPDLVAGFGQPTVANNMPYFNQVYLNRSSDTGLRFEYRTFGLAGSDDTRAVAVADLDDNGALDIITGNNQQQSYVFFNGGEGKILPKKVETGDVQIYSVAVADVDGRDGPDIVASTIEAPDRPPLIVYLNDGSGSYVATRTVTVGAPGTEARDVVLGDVNGDDRLDIVAATSSKTAGRPNYVYLNNGVGPFASGEDDGSLVRAFGSEADNTQNLALGDLNRDGFLDILAGNHGAQNAVFLNDGSGIFKKMPFGPKENKPAGMALGDVNGDNYLDAVVGYPYGNTVIYFNDTTGSFRDEPSTTIGDRYSRTTGVAVGDINGDGALDIGVGSLYGGIRLYTNNGRGSFSSNQVQIIGPHDNSTYDIAFDDIDSDGALDVIASQWNRSTPNQVYLNDGQGHFTTAHARQLHPICPESYVNRFTHSLAVGDVNRDGSSDIITGDRYADGCSKARNYRLTTYLNSSRQTKGLTDHAPTVAISDTVRDPAGRVWITYTLHDPDRDLVREAVPRSIIDGRQQFLRNSIINPSQLNTDSRITFCSERAHSESPAASVLTPNQPACTSYRANLFGTVYDVVFRLKAFPSYQPQSHRVPGPYQWPYGTATTPPLDVRGWAVQVDTGPGVPPDQAAVYRLRQETSRGALPLANAQGDVFHTNDAGRFQGQGTLNAGDQLMAVVPTAEITAHMPSQYFGSPGGQPNHLNCSYFAQGSLLTWCDATPVNLKLPLSNTHRIARASLIMDLDVDVRSLVKLRLVSPVPTCPPLIQLPTWLEPGNYPKSFPIPFCRPWGAVANGEWTLTVSLIDVDPSAKLVNAPKRRDCPAQSSQFAQQPPCSDSPYGQGVVPAMTINNWGIEATLSPLHYTSAPLITETVIVTRNEQRVPFTTLKPDLTVVSDETPALTLTISQDNPLLLFDLAVALEWDARSDRQFMEQLSANLRRVSELLYDWSNGQAALGQITVYHDARAQVRPDGTSPWSDADVRIFATNRLRPNSAQGGIVSGPFTDTDNSEITYVPGSVNIAATWNRYGDTAGNLGEDWTRALAHELGHYLFFLNDNYIGVDDQGLLVPVSECAGVMADPYRTDDENGYGEYHAAGESWQKYCAQTLSYTETRRSDWETITLFYPWLKAPPRDPANDQVSVIQSGPDILPIEVTQLSESAPVTPTTALEHPVFYLVEGESTVAKLRQPPFITLQPAAGARAFLFKSKPDAPRKYDRVVDLGRPRLDQVLARGAQPGDLLCVTDPEHRRAGCSDISAAGNNGVKLSTLPTLWKPDVMITPVTTRTPTVTVTSLQVIVTGLPAVDLKGQLFPLDGSATEIQSFSANGTTYSTTFTLTDTVPSGHLVLLIPDGQTDHRLVTDLTLGGSPAFVRGKVVFAPVLSNDGQVLLYGPDLNLKNDQVALLHAVTQVQQPPPWATVIGNAYRLAASPGVDLTGTSLSFSYLGNEVPPGEERSLYIYHWTGESWEQLETVRNLAQNVASAALRGEGLYALMSSTEISLPYAGWNLFGYPVPVPVTRTVTDTLASAGVSFTVAFGYDPGNPNDPWQVYVPGAPAAVSDLRELTFGHGYFIHTPVPGTLRFKGVSPFTDSADVPAAMSVPDTSDLALRTPPAIVYGKLDIADQAIGSDAMSITARINDSTCGQGQTFTNSSETWYVVKIQAASESSPGCGLVGRPVTLIVATADGDRTLTPATAAQVKWDNGKPQAITMTLHSADTPLKTPTANCTELVTNGGFEARRGWRLERTANPAKYTSSLAHQGSASLQLGLTPAVQSGSRGAAISSGYQFVRIPATAPSARLSFWYYTDALTQGRDYRRVVLLGDSLKPLKELARLPAVSDAWQEASFDLTPYKGRNVGIYFETYNDNTASAPRTWMAIDDVSLTVCR